MVLEHDQRDGSPDGRKVTTTTKHFSFRKRSFRNYFLCDNWLAVEKGDGLVDRVIPLASTKELKSFAHLFTQSVKKKFSDGHLWFSVFSRPVRSNFTRLQRISCCISLLFCTMISNAMFYAARHAGDGEQSRRSDENRPDRIHFDATLDQFHRHADRLTGEFTHRDVVSQGEIQSTRLDFSPTERNETTKQIVAERRTK